MTSHNKVPSVSAPSSNRLKEDHRLELIKAAKATPNFEKLHEDVSQILDIPSSMVGLWQIVSNLPEILTAAHRWANKRDESLGNSLDLIQKWLNAVTQIPLDSALRQVPIMGKVSADKSKNKNVKGPSFHGTLEDHPVWAVLWNSAVGNDGLPEKSKHDAYRSLQGLLLASFNSRPYRNSDDVDLQRYVEAGLLLRKIQKPERSGELLRWSRIGATFAAAHDYFAQMHRDSAHDNQGYGALADLISDAYGSKRPSVFKDRPLGSGKGRKKPKIDEDPPEVFSKKYVVVRDEPPEDFSERDFEFPFIVVKGDIPPPRIVSIAPDEEELKEIWESGHHPGEFTIPDEILFPAEEFFDPPDIPGEKGKLPPLASIYAAAHGRYKGMLMSAQAFKTRLKRPHVALMVKFLNILEGLALTYKTPPAGKEAEYKLIRETVKLCAVAIVTGSRLRDAAQLVGFNTIEGLPEDWTLAYSSSLNGVWLRPYLPPVRDPRTLEIFGKQMLTHPRLGFSDIWGIGKGLPSKPNDKWFERDLAEYEQLFNEVVREKLLNAGISKFWANHDRIGDLIPLWFHGLEERELLRNCAIFGRASNQADTQRHYVALDREVLNQYYCNAMSQLWYEMTKVGLITSGLFSLQQERSVIPESLTGNDFSPKPENIKLILAKLQAQIEEHSTSSPYEHHNLVAAYIGIVLGIVTGFRDVRTPILDLTLIDRETGFMSMQEKDTDDASHARLVWIPPQVQICVDQYLEHLKRLWTLLPENEPKVLLVKATKNRDRQVMGVKEFTLSLEKTLFFFEGKKEGWFAKEFSGFSHQAILNGVSQNIWAISNTGRHYAATSFFNAKGSHATINSTFLGHWGLGESAWLPDSGFDPYQFRQAIEPIIMAMLAEIEFKPIRF